MSLTGSPVDLGGVGQAEHAQRNLRQRVAIGRGALQGLRGQRAASAGFVLHHHGLAQDPAGVVGQNAHGDVGEAPGGKAITSLMGLTGKLWARAVIVGAARLAAPTG